MNINDLRSLAEQAGFSGQDIGIAAAVAMAESGGDPDILGDTALVDDKWGPSVGLWQIRSLRRPQAYGYPDTLRVESALHDPRKNAAAAYAIFNGSGGWKQWSTFTNGAYKAHLQSTPGASGMNERDLVINKAKSYLGLHETGRDRTEFGKEFGEDGVFWCDIFVWCIFNRVGLVGLLPGKFDNCGQSTEGWKREGRFSEYPGLGAQAVFGPGGGEHTGIVVSYTETTVTSVDGNWNDQVSLVTRQRRDAYVYGYGYPRYAEGIISADPDYQNQGGQSHGTQLGDNSVLPDVLYVGQVNHAAAWDPPAEQGHRSYCWPQVLRLEQALESEGLLDHPYVDGSYGTSTIEAYKQLQHNLGYTDPGDADGKPGMESLSWLGRRHGFRVEP